MARLPKLSVEAVEARLYPFFRDWRQILLAYLFGSWLDASTRVPRDLDLAVLVDLEQFKTMDREAPDQATRRRASGAAEKRLQDLQREAPRR